MIQSKLCKSEDTIFSIMSNLAVKYNAINLSQGFPDFNIDPYLVDLVTEAMKSGFNQYPPIEGSIPLRENISEIIQKFYGKYYCPVNEITITSGASQGIFTAISAFVRKGDEVIIFTPAYDQYRASIEINGGIVVEMQLRYKENYNINWKEFSEKINKNTRMVIVNSPHNPTGRVFTKEDMISFQKIIDKTKIIVLFDEVYEHIIFDNLNHESVSKFPELAKRSIAISSFGKTFHVTGWKIGYCIGPSELMKEFRKIHTYNVFCSNHPIQVAFSRYLQNSDIYSNLAILYQEKRDFFLDLIKESRFKFKPSEGTYFQLLDYSNITDEKDIDFAKRLVLEKNIASIPISVFSSNNSDEKVLRFCFAKQNETLLKAAKILCEL